MKTGKQQTMTAREWREKMGLEVRKPPKKAAPKKAKKQREGPNDNELRYRDMFLKGDPIHEGRTFTLAERCTYTPDWMAGHPIEFHEVKHDQCMGKNRQRDSKIRFKWASKENPEFIFVWAKWVAKDKAYKREFWQGGRKLK